MYLAKLFDKNPTEVIKIEMQCNAWREKVSIKLVSFFQSGTIESEIMQAVRKLLKMQKKITQVTIPDGDNSKTASACLSFEKWDFNGKDDTVSFENLKKDLKK